MGKFIRLKQGFDINLAGKAAPKVSELDPADTFVLKPTDFHGMYIPKLLVKVGDNVKAGTPIFHDKRYDKVFHVAPVSGEIVEINRGAKRKLLEIKILADKNVEFVNHKKYSVSEIANLSVNEARDLMLKSGVWPNLVQRPFGIMADPEVRPKSIFISAFDTHPLAPEYGILFKGQDHHFQVGLDILRKFTEGNIHINTHTEKEIATIFSQAKGIEMNKFSGPHPSGCVGVQIHHLDPINKGDVVWTINPFGVIQIGKLFTNGVFDASKVVAVTGSEVNQPQYYKTYTGTSVKKFLANNLKTDNVRVISGNVLTGTSIGTEGHLGFFDHQISVIPEGDKFEFMGWIAPTINKLSFHRAFGLLSFLTPGKERSLNSNMNGEPRAFVQTGIFERVTPMDILPTYLLKSIMAEDIDDMEALGIYEVVEEDLALCEFVDVSKHEVQQILREGIQLLQSS
ncbi:MAG: Na(+)-translocating NADH-quinone reductase subunit A [Flammeovirgaceae bacterium]|nr:Na(+)-translocating NADH-quinone reductase subunit A [Flammeovirgaceae bacterium]